MCPDPTQSPLSSSPSGPSPSPVLNDYEQWQLHNMPRPADLKRMAEVVDSFTYKPLISIIFPTYNTPASFLREAISSVLGQIYPNWELCIADDASTDPHVRSTLEEYAADDDRIQVRYRTDNGHISRSSNTALEMATGDFVALLDHDDLLTPDALYEMVVLLNRHPEADMIYSDEDKIDENGTLKDSCFKPDWCPDSFMSRMYTSHLGLYRHSIVKTIGGFRVGYEGSQDYDLVLRLTEHTQQIFHIPRILYHWRTHSKSLAANYDAKPYAFIAAQKALADALERRQEPGRVAMLEHIPGLYSVRYDIQAHDLVSIIIPTRDLASFLERCLESLFEKTTYPNYEVILIDNGSVEPETSALIHTWKQKEPKRFHCYEFDQPFNYSRINNFAVTKANGKYFLFLNNDTEIISPDWIDGMVEQAQRPSIGAVGAMLLYPDDTIQHAGVIVGLDGIAGHCFVGDAVSDRGYWGQLAVVNNYSAVTGACLMCRREVFDQVSGFEEELSVAFNDIDLCLKMANQGYRNIYLPHVKLYHHESKSRGEEDTPEKRDRLITECQYMIQKWKAWIKADPCYSPNLSLDYPGYKIDTSDTLGNPDFLSTPTASSLKSLLNKMQNKQNKLVESRKRVRSLRSKLNLSQERLAQAHIELEISKSHIAAMKTSKFWKLREKWFKLKLFGIQQEKAKADK